MYIFEDMINLGNQEWQTKDHRQVAINALIGNRHIRTRQDLIEGCSIVNGIPTVEIRKVTLCDLVSMGIPC